MGFDSKNNGISMWFSVTSDRKEFKLHSTFLLKLLNFYPIEISERFTKLHTSRI